MSTNSIRSGHGFNTSNRIYRMRTTSAFSRQAEAGSQLSAVMVRKSGIAVGTVKLELRGRGYEAGAS